MTADRELCVLILEDAPADAELCQRELARAGLRFKARCVGSRPAFESALAEFAPDLIISDFSLPGAFDGLSALALARAKLPEVPFIFVSGTIGEDRAVEAMKLGATDYVWKGRLQRLGPAVTRAVQEAQERIARRRAEEDIREREARHQLILDTSMDAFVTIDQSGAIMEWSRKAEAMFGWKREEVQGRLFTETIIPERYRKDHEAALRRAGQTGERKAYRPFEFQALRRTGSELPVEVAITPLTIGGQHFFSAFIRDITRRVKFQQRLSVQYAIARVLAETASFEEVPAKLLQVTCESIGFTVGALWEVDGQNGVLSPFEIWHAPSPALEEFAARTREIRLRPGAGIAGRAWKDGMPVWIPEATINPASPRALHAVQAGLLENFAFPITVRGQITGVMDFFGPGSRQPEPELLEVFASIGSQIGQFLERRNQQRKIARLNRIHAVLSSINSAIVRLRDRQKLFEEACRTAVEHGQFGLAWIGLFDPASLDVTPVAWAGLGTDEIKSTKSTARADTALGQGFVGRAIRERKPAYSNDIAAEPKGSGGKRRQEALRLGYRSIIVLPLFAGDAVAGVLALFAKEPNFFNDEELKLLTELAGDVSFSLDYLGKEEKLHYLVHYDVLTGLPNRTLFRERVAHALHVASRRGSQVAVVFNDPRRFRLVNETLGRHAGDALLRELAKRFRQALPDPGNLARVAGDCFGLLVTDIKEASDIAHFIEEPLGRAFAEPFAIEGQELRIALRSGIAVFPADGGDAETLLRNAEAAWKNAKALGERYLFYQPEMNARVAETLVLENKMRKALDAEQFVLHYQPKVTLADGRISGVEALIRWNDPESGLVPPVKFIPLLEETGMILEAGRWAIRKALEERRQWGAPGSPLPRVAVNVSPIQLGQKDFVEVVRKAIEEIGAETAGLDLEITESLIMRDIEGNIGKLRAIRDLGVNIAIDDFGTGYSSLHYLRKLPVNALKIDRSFIITMANEPDSMSIVSAIISLAHTLNLKVVAEGVDAEEQSRILKLLNCDEMQGYLFSKPLPSHGLADLLQRHGKSLA